MRNDENAETLAWRDWADRLLDLKIECLRARAAWTWGLHVNE